MSSVDDHEWPAFRLREEDETARGHVATCGDSRGMTAGYRAESNRELHAHFVRLVTSDLTSQW